MNDVKNSTGWRLFKTIIHCRVKAKHLIDLTPGSENDPTSRRFATTGDESYDLELADSFNDVYIPPSDIAELIEEGADVLIVNPGDIERVYSLICDHLHWWSDRMRTEYLYIPDKIKRIKRDIQVLSNAADRLYPMVCEQIKKSHKDIVWGPKNINTPELLITDIFADATLESRLPTHAKHHELFNPDILNRVRAWER